MRTLTDRIDEAIEESVLHDVEASVDAYNAHDLAEALDYIRDNYGPFATQELGAGETRILAPMWQITIQRIT